MYFTSESGLCKATTDGQLSTVLAFGDNIGPVVQSLGAVLQASDGLLYFSEDETDQCPGDCPLPAVVGFDPVQGTLKRTISFAENSLAGLAEGSDGALYGGSGQNVSSYFGGFEAQYSAFRIDSSGNVSSFSQATSQAPVDALTLGSDGNFYGVGENSIFQLQYSGAVNILISLCPAYSGLCPDDAIGGLIQASDGNFYGTTDMGGSGDFGTAFQVALSPALPPPVQLTFSNASVAVGESTTLTFQVRNAFSDTAQQCFSFVQGVPAGQLTGAVTDGIYQGTETVSQAEAGVYTYALTCGGVESGLAILRVGGAKSASTAALTSNGPVTIGQPITLTASVGTTQSLGALTGTVTFSVAGETLGSAPVANGSASLTFQTSGIPRGTYSVTATYSGDGNYQPSATTANVTLLGYATSVALTPAAASFTQGQSETLRANVTRTSEAGVPTGTVTFAANGQPLATETLINGTATYTAQTNTAVPAGSYSVTATYNGDASDQPATFASAIVTLLSATETTLTVQPNPVPANSAATFTVHVKQVTGTAIPQGQVQFTVGGEVLDTVTLDPAGTATANLSDTGIPAGTYPLQAVYLGSTTQGASASAPTQVRVQ